MPLSRLTQSSLALERHVETLKGDIDWLDAQWRHRADHQETMNIKRSVRWLVKMIRASPDFANS